MSSKPEFDPERASAMRRMLVNEVRNTRPSVRSRVALLVTLGAVAVALAFGGAAWALSGAPWFLHHAPRPTHSVTPTPTPTATSTPTPTPTPTTQATFSTTCSSLVPEATIDALVPNPSIQPPMGYDVAPPSGDPRNVSRFSLTGPPPANNGWGVLASLQSGWFDCEWRGDAGTLVLGVLPDGGAAYQPPQAGAPASNPSGAITPSIVYVGDSSYGTCEVDGATGPGCVVYAKGDGVSLGAFITTPNAVPQSQQATVVGQLRAVIQGALSSIANSPTPPAPVAQQSSRWTGSTCTSLTPGLTAADPSLGALQEKQLEMDDDVYPFAQTGTDAGSIGCIYAGGTWVAIIPGAGWAVPMTYPGAGVVGSVSVSGASNTSQYCPTGIAAGGAGCWYEGVIDGALVAVYGGGSAPPLSVYAALARG